MFISLTILALTMTLQTATAGNVTQQPNPELLRRFEAERDAAQAVKQAAQEKQKRADEKIQRAETKKKQVLSELDAELCRIGALPASECP